MANETATLAAYVADLKFEDIPPEVLARAKVLTLDFLGSTIRARRDAESTPSLLKMLEALALDGKGESTVFGDSKTWTPAVAALLKRPVDVPAGLARVIFVLVGITIGAVKG